MADGESPESPVPVLAPGTVIMVPKVKKQGTVITAPNFSAAIAAESLHKAMAGLGTNDRKLISVLTHHTNEQRQEIAKVYMEKYQKDLQADLISDLSGHYKDTALSLFVPTILFDVKELKRAMKGFGTDESTLVEILFSRKTATIQKIKETYEAEYGVALEADIDSETGGDFRRLLQLQLKSKRDETKGLDINLEMARQDAQELYRAGEGRLGTNESKFDCIFCSRSFGHLKKIIQFYEEITGHELEKAIEKETSGDLKKAYLGIVSMARGKPYYFAQRIHKFIKGLGTKDLNLIRVVITRSEIDMVQVKEQYEKLYNVSLASSISGDTSGDYKELLLALIGERILE